MENEPSLKILNLFSTQQINLDYNKSSRFIKIDIDAFQPTDHVELDINEYHIGTTKRISLSSKSCVSRKKIKVFDIN